MARTPTEAALLERLETLERAQRRWKRIGVGLMLATGLLTAAGAAELSETLEAQEFILRDKDGKARASWTIRPDGTPGLGFFDTSGHIRMSLDMSAKDEPGVNLYDEEGRLRTAVAMRPNGTPGIGLFDRQGQPRLSLDIGLDDAGGVNIYGPGARLRAALAIRPDGTPGLGLFDEAGQVRESIEIGGDAEDISPPRRPLR